VQGHGKGGTGEDCGENGGRNSCGSVWHVVSDYTTQHYSLQISEKTWVAIGRNSGEDGA
jgi:hypothetical protein